ncbi:MAG: GatB/YqeY domain-containing protein [Candidatus Saccharibacteria bacterium]
MTIKEQIDIDLKTALLGGDKQTASVLRGLKGAILNVEIEKKAREAGLPEAEVLAVLTKQAKQRQESADMYVQGNSPDRAQAELEEKATIEKYLPKQMGDEELASIVDTVIADTGATGPQAMGQVIGAVKQQTAGQADGGRIAQLVKAKLV